MPIKILRCYVVSFRKLVLTQMTFDISLILKLIYIDLLS